MRYAAYFLFALAIMLARVAIAEIPRPEHPRPDMQRENWQNLNGVWSFDFDEDDRGLDERWYDKTTFAREITVPFPVESELSGIGERKPPETSWYLLEFDLADNLRGEGRVLLHFGAVDYHATAWLNGQKLGEHKGGYTPFSFDVTEAVKPEGNTLAVRVWDSLDRMQVRGKQTDTGEPYGIMYTTVTGIWQTVWLERVGRVYVENYTFTTDQDLAGGCFRVQSTGEGMDAWSEIVITTPGGIEESVEWGMGQACWTTDDPRPWSPESPTLYGVRISLKDCDGNVVDNVSTYVGIRTIETRGDKIYLNGQELYQKLLLDQGYFPGGHYSPATDAAMKGDVESYKAMGFNGLRKHQKVEDPRFLYWCDRLGLVVWEEMPSLGFGGPYRVPGWAMERFRDEWMAVIDRDRNHPSIIVWTVYNENWGIYEMPWRDAVRDWAYEMVWMTRQADPTRLVVDNSGGWHFDTDIWDFHQYLPTVEATRLLYKEYDLQPGDYLGTSYYLKRLLRGVPVIPSFLDKVAYDGQPVILSEYGGFGFYRVTEEGKGLLELYADYTMAAADYNYIRGYCYTQPYDVEQEENGLMTFDREPKVSVEGIAEANDRAHARYLRD